MAKTKKEIQPGFEPGSSKLRSDALTNRDTGSGIGVEDRWCIFIDTVRLTDWIFRSKLAVLIDFSWFLVP